MSDPYIGEIRIVGFSFAPYRWALCDGQTIPISQNPALFSILGTTYGGNGTTTFGLPDLRGRAPLHQGQAPGGSSFVLGETGGSTSVTLLTTQLPSHNHPILADDTGGGLLAPTANTWGQPASRTPAALYSDATPNSAMSSAALGATGSGGAHNNLSPYLAMYFAICMQGVFPARN